MKKYFSYAFAGAIALTGAVGFASCSTSGEDVVSNINQPDYNPSNNSEQDAVKTQFTISFPKNVATTRQSGTTVQNDPAIANFRGMDNIVLLPFAATGDAGNDPVASSANKLSDKISLTKIIKPSSTDVTNSIPAGTAGLLAGSNSVLFNDVTIPVGTGSFLFYGKAKDSGTDNFVNGSLSMTGTQPNDFLFTPVQTYSASTPSTTGQALAEYLSSIAQAENWAGCAAPANSGETWYNSGLGDLYTKFTNLKAGSSLDVQAAIQDLYKTIKNNTDAVSANIKAKILSSDYVTSTENPTTLSFKAILGNSFTTGDGKTLYFPFDVNLPDGAALLSYDESAKTFTQKTDGNDNTGHTAKYADYVYPASLYYYCNSGIKTSNSSKLAEYDGSQNWTTISGKYTDGTAVSSSTRSVAILDPIQYAVGRLDMTIKTANNTLYDKNGDTYNATNGFTVTGVLIGGQKAVGFNFEPKGTTSYTIYDNIQKFQPLALTATTTASTVNYTLALETAPGTTVNVAIELINNGEDFQGADGVVPAGCKFYLVAVLDPSADNATDGSKVTNSAYTGKRVFKQDFNTIANFTIAQGTSGSPNTKGLAAAYNTIPDLRTPELELGLSVDLTWQPGITFELDL